MKQANQTSNNMLASKFKQEFIETVTKLFMMDHEQLRAHSATSSRDYRTELTTKKLPNNIPQKLNYSEYCKLLYCLGFIKSLHHDHVDNQADLIRRNWSMLKLAESQHVETDSLYNFLCYLQNFNRLVIEPE